MITKSKIDANGRETMVMCIHCSLDNRNICNGTKIVLVNDHKHNNYLIYKSIVPMGYKELQKGKGETLDTSELERWITANGYVEDEKDCRKRRNEVEHDR